METSSQLHHDLILPSDEGADQSLGDMEGLLSSRHKQLLLKVRTVCSVCSVSPCAAVPRQEGELQVHAGRGRQRQGHRGRAAPPAGGEREDTEEAPVWEVHPVTQSGQAESLGWATSRHVTSRDSSLPINYINDWTCKGNSIHLIHDLIRKWSDGL